MTTHQVENNQINIRIQGEGEPIIFLHGVPDSSEVWSATIDSLSNQFKCIAPDLPGFGSTKASNSFQYDLESLANFVDQLVNSLNLQEKVHLVIHDVGGIVGLAFATKYPEKVKSLTIMDTTFFSDHVWHSMANTWRKPIVGDLTMHLMRFKQFRLAMKKAAPILTDQQIRSNYGKLTFRNRRMILKFYRTLDPSVFHSWEERMVEATRKIQTQVIWGENDTFLPVSLASRFGTDRVHVLDGVGHWPMLERPTEVHNLIRKHVEFGQKTKGSA